MHLGSGLGGKELQMSVRTVSLAPECVERFGVLTAAVRIKVHRDVHTYAGGGAVGTLGCGGSGKHHVYLSVREAQGPPHPCPVKCVVVLEVHFSPNWPLSRLLMATRSKLGVGGRGRMCFVCVCVGRSEESGRSLPAHSTTPSFFSVCWGP